MPRKVTIIAAVSDNGVIGYRGSIPWGSIPEDMKHFRDITMGNPVVMGRKTYDSLPARFRPLPGRTNIVLSKSLDEQTSGVFVAKDPEEALNVARMSHSKDDNTYVIGGSLVYGAFLPLATNLELTRVRGNFEGDAFFPFFNMDGWNLTSRDAREGYTFESYQRK